jgi:hemerythrin-like domain-containing protein
MTTPTAAQSFQARDAVHQQIQAQLARLVAWRDIMADGADLDEFRDQLVEIEEFFSGHSRQHHEDEEKNVFPLLLSSTDDELVQAVKTLQQDHHWIELDWRELAPMLKGVAQGEDWVDMTELEHAIDVFTTLCQEHIELEETLIYPEAKSKLAEQLAKRTPREQA